MQSAARCCTTSSASVDIPAGFISDDGNPGCCGDLRHCSQSARGLLDHVDAGLHQLRHHACCPLRMAIALVGVQAQRYIAAHFAAQQPDQADVALRIDATLDLQGTDPVGDRARGFLECLGFRQQSHHVGNGNVRPDCAAQQSVHGKTHGFAPQVMQRDVYRALRIGVADHRAVHDLPRGGHCRGIVAGQRRRQHGVDQVDHATDGLTTPPPGVTTPVRQRCRLAIADHTVVAGDANQYERAQLAIEPGPFETAAVRKIEGGGVDRSDFHQALPVLDSAGPMLASCRSAVQELFSFKKIAAGDCKTVSRPNDPPGGQPDS